MPCVRANECGVVAEMTPSLKLDLSIARKFVSKMPYLGHKISN